jgi:hypothetical protein
MGRTQVSHQSIEIAFAHIHARFDKCTQASGPIFEIRALGQPRNDQRLEAGLPPETHEVVGQSLRRERMR